MPLEFDPEELARDVKSQGEKGRHFVHENSALRYELPSGESAHSGDPDVAERGDVFEVYPGTVDEETARFLRRI